MPDNVYFYSAPALLPGSKNLNLNDFKGKVLLIVNVATEWGITKINYDQLKILYQNYKSKGLEIICQPCNQFGLLRWQIKIS